MSSEEQADIYAMGLSHCWTTGIPSWKHEHLNQRAGMLIIMRSASPSRVCLSTTGGPEAAMQVVATLVPCFQQWTGINSVMFYAPIIFKTINPQSGALLATMITGVINVVATFISIALVEKAGRKVSAVA